MRKIILVTFLISSACGISGQRNADYGVTAGTTSYIGDINPGRLFYSVQPAAGLFYRYNLHPRQSLRMNLLAGGLSGNDLDFNNDFQQARASSFSGMVGEWSTMFEFNFFPYHTQGKRWKSTPYLAAGAGIAFINTTSFTYTPVIPFSAGFKLNFYKNLGIEAEIGFRKTFYDNFDGLTDLTDPAENVWLHNNDWYTYTGLSVTWKIYNKLAGCPVYDDVRLKRKR
ncbi:MAG TPA: DUF6089 family protein [Bacteroidales bacterium]|nr:DUF6089 family protein [Bacteroidales bacterium]HRR93204.1 DUF6089 family protein [Bacteroidales bacterium]HRT88567.1 DUF6089 family protein [Bacteroidales bacterium]